MAATIEQRHALAKANRRKRIRLGDAVAAIATPIARTLRLQCIDPATQDLRPESKCAERKARLNALTS